jgi:hypothetical protein
VRQRSASQTGREQTACIGAHVKAASSARIMRDSHPLWEYSRVAEDAALHSLPQEQQESEEQDKAHDHVIPFTPVRGPLSLLASYHPVPQ